MIPIYRIQDKDGRGPFKPGFSNIWIYPRADHENLLPWFTEFGRIDQQVKPGYFSGSACRSIKQLQRWFNPREYLVLKQLGYNAVRLEADSILAASSIQCFFERKKPLNKRTEIFDLWNISKH